jgi:23S rRNA (pseudouridine1915-N3)-methyltransferase
MRWTIITVGKPSLIWAREGATDYLTRLQRGSRVECIHLREGPAAQINKQMLEASEGSLRVLLDERGQQHRSMALADWIKRHELHGTKRVCLMIGGANGHSAELRAAAGELWSLSALTLQHELALVVLLEQIYRAYSIIRGEPYHRE